MKVGRDNLVDGVTYRGFMAMARVGALWASSDTSKFFKLFSNFHVTVLSNQEEPSMNCNTDSSLTYEEASKILAYDPETGEIHRLNKRSTTNKPNKTGYKTLTIQGKTYGQHRLAWLLHYKKWPDNHINHINGIPSDNRICNLEDVLPLVNANSYRKISSSNKSGYKNVYWMKSKQKWAASKMYYGVSYFLGLFETAEEANDAVIQFKKDNKLAIYSNEHLVNTKLVRTNSPRGVNAFIYELHDNLTRGLAKEDIKHTPGDTRTAMYTLIARMVKSAVPGESLDEFFERTSAKLQQKVSAH